MASFSAEFDAISTALTAAFGADPPDRSEPVDPFRGLLLLVLEQQRGIRSDRAIEALDADGYSTDPEALAGADPGELVELLRGPRGVVPSGVVPLLQRVAGWVAGHGGIEGMAEVDTETLRDELRAIKGIGPSSNGRILLEVLNRPTFPIGRSDYRILIRHGWVDPGSEETEVREAVELAAPDDPDTMRRVASWFDTLSGLCRVSKPKCDRCPLQPFLPEGGPLDPE